ncbi:hypothetical protein Tco_0039085 [Tanacetum coccineum]
MINERRDLLQKVMDLDDFAIKDSAQKTKIKWIKDGDENTKMYHGILKRKRRQNNISGVVIDGEWVTDPKMVKETLREHYATKFQPFSGMRSSNRSSRYKRLSDMQVEMLERTFSDQEIQDAVWAYGCDKAPGPDGFSFRFLRRF